MKRDNATLNEEGRNLLRHTHPGFTIVCQSCESDAVGVESDVGFSPQSGAWGGVSLHCSGCGRDEYIWEP